MGHQEIILKKLYLEFCRRSTAGALAFIASTIPLLLYPLISVSEKPYHSIYLFLVSAIIPVNLLRIYFAKRIEARPDNIPNSLQGLHATTIIINALCYGLFIGLVFWSLPISSIGFIVSIIILSAISSGTTSSLVLAPLVQFGFLFLAAILPILELFVLSVFRQEKGYGLLASLLAIYISYLIGHSRLYYKKMTQLYEYEERLLGEKHQLQDLVDDLKKAQEEILTQKARADHASRLAAIGEMASGIAHEINNPLSIIQGNLKHIQTLAEQNNEIGQSVKNEFAERSLKIQNSVTRISRIINGLKLFSRQRKDGIYEKVNFRMIIDNTLELCGERFNLNSINLEIEECPKEEVTINIAQISQVLHHLLNNSFEAVLNSPGPTVKILMEIKKNFLAVSVQDNGVGIPIDIKNKIFIPFFTSKEVGKGPGLGLSISRGIIEQHGGMLVLEEDSSSSEVNATSWTTFTFTLPVNLSS